MHSGTKLSAWLRHCVLWFKYYLLTSFRLSVCSLHQPSAFSMTHCRLQTGSRKLVKFKPENVLNLLHTISLKMCSMSLPKLLKRCADLSSGSTSETSHHASICARSVSKVLVKICCSFLVT